MIQDQSRVIDFMSRPDSFGAGIDVVEKIDTHISVIFLAGERAFKLKRAVKYPYVDYSSIELRHHYCQAEYTINHRMTPQLYVGVVAVTRGQNGGLELDGTGEAVDWLVEMTRFDQDTLFDRLARDGKLTRHLMSDLAETIARFHQDAPKKPMINFRDVLTSTVAGDAAAFTEFGKSVFSKEQINELIEAENRAIRDLCGGQAEQRQAAGLVRHCHGDLHLRNIFLHEGRPTLFDAIEFNPLLTEIDVFYDLAFLLMDLDHRGDRRFGNVVLNRYLDMTGDTAGLACLPLYLCMRAAIRAHVAAAALPVLKSAARVDLKKAEAGAYVTQALNYLKPQKPRLIAVGGLSGSGKSRLGREMAPYVGIAPGARIARSDVLRKKLAGVDQLTRLGPEGYTPEMTKRTYQALYDQVRATLATGHSAIADAVFATPEERKAIAHVAQELNVPFQGIWLQAPPQVMAERIGRRQNNASDADARVLARQLQYDLGDIEWPRLDSSGTGSETLAGGLGIAGLKIQSDTFLMGPVGG